LVFLALTGEHTFTLDLLHQLLRPLLWALVLMGGAAGAARLLGSTQKRLPHFIWDGAVGVGLVAVALILLGLIPGGFRPIPLAVFVLALTGIALMRWLGFPRAVLLDSQSPEGEPEADSGGAVVLVLGVVAALGLIWNRVPPVFFDTLSYHFAQPNLWLAEGVVRPYPWSLHSWFPPGMSALYGLGLAFGGDTLANDANLLVGLLFLGLVWDLARRLWGKTAALVALGWLMAQPLTLYLLAIPAADRAYATFSFAAIGAWILSREYRSTRWLRRAALLAGAAGATKYLGFMVPLSLLLFLEVLVPGPWGMRQRLGNAGLLLCLAMLVVAPWLVTNAVVLGNPVAPELADILPVRGLAPHGLAEFHTHALAGPPHDLQKLSRQLITGSNEPPILYPSPAFGWLVVVMLPALALALRGHPRLKLTFVLCALTFGVWLCSFRWERFLGTTVALFALSCAGASVILWRRSRLTRILLLGGAAVGVLNLVLAGLTVASFTGGVPVALGIETPTAFAERCFPMERFFRRCESILDSKHHRVLFVGEMRHHHFDIPHAAPTGFNIHPLAQAFEQQTSPSSISRYLLKRGFTHILVTPYWIQHRAGDAQSLQVFKRQPQRLTAYLDWLGPPLVADRFSALWHLEPSPAPDGAGAHAP